jgi:hypothetical protein
MFFVEIPSSLVVDISYLLHKMLHQFSAATYLAYEFTINIQMLNSIWWRVCAEGQSKSAELKQAHAKKGL